MIKKSYWISFIMWIIVDLLDMSQGSSVGSSLSTESSLSNATNDSSEDNDDCRDYAGRVIQHSMEFVPKGVDMCRLCICENGHEMSCRAVLCTPPPCQAFQMGSQCCEFTCLYEEASSASTTTEMKIIQNITNITSTGIIASVSFSLLFFVILNSFQILF